MAVWLGCVAVTSVATSYVVSGKNKAAYRIRTVSEKVKKRKVGFHKTWDAYIFFGFIFRYPTTIVRMCGGARLRDPRSAPTDRLVAETQRFRP